MITPDWCRMMAAYNTEMNRRLYDAAERLPEAERKADRGAWFGSVQGTLSHLLWCDHTWMARLSDWQRLPGENRESANAFPDWAELRTARREADAKIETWAAGLDEARLQAPLTWFSGASGKEMRKPTWVLVTHFFNHQTHHRGQAHCLVTQAGIRPEATDLPWVVDLAALGLE